MRFYSEQVIPEGEQKQRVRNTGPQAQERIAGGRGCELQDQIDNNLMTSHKNP